MSSVMSIMVSLLITGALSLFFVYLTRLTGYGDENSTYLMQFSSVPIDPRGLLLGGMIIGSSGVLDAIWSHRNRRRWLRFTMPTLRWDSGARFKRPCASVRTMWRLPLTHWCWPTQEPRLPLLLIFTLGNGSYSYFINSEFLAEEIVRTLVGSLGLIAAVPISTVLATRNYSLSGTIRTMASPAGSRNGR